jgi:hypothetical protein
MTEAMQGFANGFCNVTLPVYLILPSTSAQLHLLELVVPRLTYFDLYILPGEFGPVC